MNGTDDIVQCQARGCYDGVRWDPCELCAGTGYAHDGAGPACAACEGAGEVHSGACRWCRGTGATTAALARLLEAALAAAYAPPVSHGDGRWQQPHDGVTVYALAAYLHLRPAFTLSHAVNVGAALLAAPGLPPEPGVVVAGGGLELALTGVTWGRGGEGGDGLAVILADLFAGGDVAVASSTTARITAPLAGLREARLLAAALPADSFTWNIGPA